MKQSAIRLCSAVLLMALALVGSVAMIGAVPEEQTDEKEAFVWIRMCFAAEEQVQEIRLYAEDGTPTQSLQTDGSGRAVSDLMIPGRYYAVTPYGCTEFVLHENASVSTEGGCGWSDGEVLHLTAAEVGTVTVERPGSTAADEWLDYTLKNTELERREVVRCRNTDEAVHCTFEGIPYGTYVLAQNGVEQCRVTVDAEERNVTVALP